VSADFREINRILTKSEWWLQFIKSSPIFFMNQDDEIIECDELHNDLKLWLMSCKQEYYVFLNCGIRRYDDYLGNLRAFDNVKYDMSYPIFERLISRNGRYWGKAFEFQIYEKEGMFNQKTYETQYLKSIMQEFFPEEEFMKKYFTC